MDGVIRIILVVAMTAGMVIAVAIGRGGSGPRPAPPEYRPEKLTGKGLAVLVGLGSDKCISGKMTVPILDELRTGLCCRLISLWDARPVCGISEAVGQLVRGH